jgi:hypothetical protein
MTRLEENVFIYSNPLFWIYFIFFVIYYTLGYILNTLGISEWIYILFKFKKEDIEVKKKLTKYIEEYLINKPAFLLKKKAWRYAIKITNKELNK